MSFIRVASRKGLLLCAYIVFARTSFAATVDGLVTAASLQTVFYLGNVRVTLNSQTKCERNTALNLDIYPAEDSRMRDGAQYLIRRHKAVPVACDATQIAIGTRVRVTGEWKDSAQVVADKVTEYPVVPQGKLSGNVLLEEDPKLHPVDGALAGNLSIDGYSVSVSPRTSIVTNNRSKDADLGVITSNMWVTYDAENSPHAGLHATRLDATTNDSRVTGANYTNIVEPKYSQRVAGEIQDGLGKSIEIVPNKAVQSFVTNLGRQLIPQFQKALPESDGYKVPFRFFVVRSSDVLREKKFLTINGVLPFNTSDWGANEYAFNKVKLYARIDNTIAMSDGVILVPMQILPRLQNEAELAALLSYSITSVLQDQIAKASSVVESDSQYVKLHRFDAMLKIDERTLRIGIRQMYLAGYDIREAPFAWAVAQGKPVNNPAINSKHADQEIPWYAAYAFNYISQYYSGVDYGKLKKGEAEYQQFLGELRKADPGAFAAK